MNNKVDKPGGNNGPDQAVFLIKSPLGSDAFIVIVIAMFVFALYMPALEAGFVADDTYLILKNKTLTGQKPLHTVFTGDFFAVSGKKSGFYRPVVLSSYWIDSRLFNGKAQGFHLSNILFHLLCSVMLYLCFLKWCPNRPTALFASLFFAAHPAHVQSVTWISGRTDVLATLFILGALLAYLERRAGSPRKRMVLLSISFGFYMLALLSKEVAVVFPVLVILVDWAKEGRRKSIADTGQIAIYAGYFGLVVIYIILRTIIIGVPDLEVQTWRNWYPDELADISPLATVLKLYFYYFKTLAWPIHLVFKWTLSPSLSWTEPQFLMSTVIVPVLLLLGIFCLFRSPVIGVGLVWFFITLLPVIQIIQIPELAAEHFLYLPSAGFCLALGGLARYSMTPWPGGSRFNKIVSWMLVFLIISLYAILVQPRHRIFMSEHNLLNDITFKFPDLKHGERKLGKTLYQQGNLKDALRHFRNAVIADARDYEAHFYIATILSEMGNLEKAQKEFQLTIRLTPFNPEVHNNFAVMLEQKGDLEGAIREYQAALELDPGLFSALSNLGKVYIMIGKCEQARDIQVQMGEKTPSSLLDIYREKCGEK